MIWSRPQRYTPTIVHGDDHDDDALERLAPGRPVDLPQLGVRLADELSALLLGLAAGLLLDGLLRRPDLRPRARGVRSLRPVTGGRARRTALLAGLASHLSGLPMQRVRPHQRQYFLNSTRSGEFRLDFCVW